MNKKFTVTVSIPAHNEEANILYLLRSILVQRGNNFVIEKILIVCDGCTDNTAQLGRNMARKHKKIEVIEDGKRKGKMARLNEIYKMNKSDILITLDADIIVAENNAFKKIVSVFEDPSLAIAVFHQEPVESDFFIGKICAASDRLWIESRIHVNGGDNIHNLQGAATALRKEVVQRIRYPSGLNTDSGYLYMSAKKFGKFKYVYDAKVLYRAPETLYDFWSLASRAIFHRRKSLMRYLGGDINKEYKIPIKYKIAGMTKMFLKSPLYFLLAIIFNALVRIFPRKDKAVTSKTWEMAQSAKKAIIK